MEGKKILMSLCMAMLLSVSTWAATYVVHPNGFGDYPTIQAAINAVGTGDHILLTDGTFTGPGNRNIDFKGKAITVRSQSGDPNLCIIDCQGAPGNPRRGFKFVTGEGPNSALRNVTITNGYVDSTLADDKGGGILCKKYVNMPLMVPSEPTISNCIITGNTATSHGGGMYASECSPILYRCTFSDNFSGWEGGGLYYVASGIRSPRVEYCTFSENGSAGHGGGMCYGCWDSMFCACLVENCNFVHNHAADDGGGLALFGTDNTIEDCVFTNNHTPAHGGGMTDMSDNATLVRCSFSNNLADTYGGGLSVFDPDCQVVNCTFSNNVSREGGGVYNGAGNSTMTNCLLSGNVADVNGGGICHHGSTSTLTNCTLSDNSAPLNGGGIHLGVKAYSSNTIVNNTIIAFSTQGQAVTCDLGSLATLTFCDVYGNAGGDWVGCIAGQLGISGNIMADPCFVGYPMISYWKLDEGFGSTANDSANGNDGTIAGATWTTGKVDAALLFHGSTSDRVRVPHSSSLNITGQFAAEAWIKATGADSYAAIVEKYSGSTSKGFSLYLSNGKLRLSIYSGASGTKDVIGTSDLRDNTWHHVVGL
ncbi:MAG: LamG-like jellyroll fold domain-containing protein, partial [Planctomycetota bacterium]